MGWYSEGEGRSRGGFPVGWYSGWQEGGGEGPVRWYSEGWGVPIGWYSDGGWGGAGSCLFAVTIPSLFSTHSQEILNLTLKPSSVRAQELCESRGGRRGLLSLISLRFLWT